MKIILMLILTLLFVSYSQDPADIAGDVSISDELSSEITDKTVTELKPDLEAVDYEKAEVTFVVIPVTNTRTDMIGHIIEDMAYYSYMYVRSAYYDVTLEGK